MNRKIKILYTIPNFDTAGSGKVLYDLANNLDKEKFDVHIACSNKNGIFFKEIENLKLPIHIINTTCKVKPYWSLIIRLKNFKKFVQVHRFDIVHSFHWSSDWTEVLSSKWGGAKFIYSKKAMTWGNIHWKIKSYLSDFIITTNDEMKHYFPNKKNQKLIPFGLDTNHYSPNHYSEKSNSEKFTIITVANLVPVKGIEILIDAVVLLNNPNIEVLIIGDDNTDYAKFLKQKIEKLAKLNSFSFLGKHNDVRPFIAKSDLYIIPSFKEGMPMALVEAMSMGIPVLGSKIPGINFVLHSFPELLFEVTNSKILSSKISSIIKLSKIERNHIGSRLRDFCISNFSISIFVKEHTKLYQEIMQK